MNMKIFVFFSGLLFFLSAHAEIFKCKVNGKVIYQHEQCAGEAAVQGVIKESSPEKVEQAKLKLKAWQDHIASEDAAKKEAEKQQQAELEKQEKLDLERRSVAAQERQAIAAQQPQKPVVVPVPMFVPGHNQQYWNGYAPPYFNNGQFDNHHQHDTQYHDQPQQERRQQSYSQTMFPPSSKPEDTTKTNQKNVPNFH